MGGFRGYVQTILEYRGRDGEVGSGVDVSLELCFL